MTPFGWAICGYGRSLNKHFWNCNRKTTIMNSRKFTKTHTKKNKSQDIFYEWTKNVYNITQDSILVAFPTFFCCSPRQNIELTFPELWESYCLPWKFSLKGYTMKAITFSPNLENCSVWLKPHMCPFSHYIPISRYLCKWNPENFPRPFRVP